MPAPDKELRVWLRELRERSGLSQEQLARDVGTDRRTIHRWEVQGHDPGACGLLRVLSALGVRIEPAPPGEGPRATNVELHGLGNELARLAQEAATRHAELLSRLDAQDARVRELAARPGERPTRRSGA